MMSPLGFESRVGSALFVFFCGGGYNVHSLRSTSGATHTEAHRAASHYPTCISRDGTWLGIRTGNHEHATIVSATRLGQHLLLTRSFMKPWFRGFMVGYIALSNQIP